MCTIDHCFNTPQFIILLFIIVVATPSSLLLATPPLLLATPPLLLATPFNDSVSTQFDTSFHRINEN